MTSPAHTDTATTVALFADPAIDALFAAPAHIQRMLDVEAALAAALSRHGLVPAESAQAIAGQCDAAMFDIPAILRGTDLAGNAAIPLVKALAARVAAADPAAAGWVHWGATSQDIIDTATMLQVRDALDHLLARTLGLIDHLAALAARERDTPMVARTLLQQAVPTTFGFKVAGWLDAVLRSHGRLAQVRQDGLALQFGGAAGALSSLGPHGADVAATLAAQLRLPSPDIAWHAHRDRIVGIAATLAILAGTLGKVARDIVLLMQSEVAEVREPAAPGKGGSSAMPHKRNPVGSLAAAAAAIRAPGLLSTLASAMPHEHERAVGGWHAEWETLPELFRLVAGSLRHMQDMVAGLEIDRERMLRNLQATAGLARAEAVAMALSRTMGRQRAHALVEAATRRAAGEGLHLLQVLLEDDALSQTLDADGIRALFEAPPGADSGHGRWIDNVLARASGLGRPTEAARCRS